MGGDHAPKSEVTGAVSAVKENDDLNIILVGNENIIDKELAGWRELQKSPDFKNAGMDIFIRIRNPCIPFYDGGYSHEQIHP